MIPDDHILELLSRWQKLREQGQAPSIEELCRDYPDLVPAVKQRVAHLQGPEPSPSTALDPLRDPTPSETATANADVSPPRSTRYQALRLHARGGLGEVFLAYDAELQREVALKRIRPGRVHDLESRRRFLREAQITSRLEHPGIVPVHGLLHDQDGQPCYAMRFIQGETLQQAIDRFHENDTRGRNPGERSLALRQLLARFLAVCNTMAYAHSRGVLHRDIKPANIMLGKYGETLLVDWGLAKPLERDRAVPTDSHQPATIPATEEDISTQLGSVIGTPAYMSPEQAAGEWDRVGPASDIYSLGATLYTVLTGHVPTEGSAFPEVLERIKQGNIPSPRQRKRDVPAALDAICQKAMALQPDARYATALDLATDVEHWLAEEPVTVYREALPARLVRWMRRHRAWASAAAALVVTAIVALAVGLLAVNHQKGLTEQALAAESQALTAKTQALAAEAKAKLRTRQALDEMSSELIENWFSRQEKLQPAQETFLKKALAYYQEFAHEVGDTLDVRQGVVNAQLRTADILQRLGQYDAAEQAYRNALTAGKQLVADFPSERGCQCDLAKIHSNRGILLQTRGRAADAETAFRSAVSVLTRLVADSPGVPEYRQRLASSQTGLAILLESMGRVVEAEPLYLQALALRKQLVNDSPGDSKHREALSASYNDLGVLFKQTDRPQEAEESYRNALTLRKQLAAEFPDVPVHRRGVAMIYYNLAIFFRQTNRSAEAEAAFADAVAIYRELAADFPAVPIHRQELAYALNSLGNLRLNLAKWDEAETAYRESLKIRTQLATDYPAVPDHRDEVAITMCNLAEVYRHRKENGLALQILREALPHHQAALHANAAKPSYRGHFRTNRELFAQTLLDLGEYTAAAEAADQLLAAAGVTAGDVYAAACIFARCMPLAEHDQQLSDAQRQDSIRNYADRALATLRQAVKDGYNDGAHLKQDHDLDPLRSHREFQKLVQELERK
ncbi:MAG TPA: serine/threonine-protein kinase [Gemmataceae bacterium]|nr:serine/threonine-protein kinase [Gemmataceae bacterium]